MKHAFKSFLAAALLAASLSASAADVIDQNAPANNTHMAAFSQGGLAQSFQQTASNVSGAGILLKAGIGSQDTVTISLWDALPTTGGHQLASASAMGTAGSWVDVFWSPVSVTPKTTLYLLFGGNTTLGIAGDTRNGYAGGNVFANSGYEAFSSFDYTFRTYASTAPVPEPETYAMMMAGLGLMGAMARRRKAKAA